MEKLAMKRANNIIYFINGTELNMLMKLEINIKLVG
jgi:hypothetical protein